MSIFLQNLLKYETADQMENNTTIYNER